MEWERKKRVLPPDMERPALPPAPYPDSLRVCVGCPSFHDASDTSVDSGRCVILCTLSNTQLWVLVKKFAYGTINALDACWRMYDLGRMNYELGVIELLLNLAEFRVTHTSRGRKGEPMLDCGTYLAILFILRRHLIVFVNKVGSYIGVYPFLNTRLTSLGLRTSPVFEDRIPADVVQMVMRYVLPPCRIYST